MSDIKIVIGADVSDLNRKLTQAGNITKDFAGKVQTGSNQATVALTNLGRVAQDSAFGFVGIANNLNPLLESFQRLRLETGSNKAALQALGSSLIGAGGIGLALSVVTAAVTFAQMGFSAWTRGVNENNKAVDESAKSFTRAKDSYQIFTEELLKTTDALSKQAAEISVIFGALGDVNIKTTERAQLITRLNELSPEYLRNLNAEKSSYEDISNAISNYIDDLGKTAFIKSFLPEFEGIFKKLIAAQVELRQLELGQKGIFGLTDSDYQAEKKRIETQIRLLKQDIVSAKKFLTREAGGEVSLYEILFGKRPPKEKIKKEVDETVKEVERQLGSLFPPGKVIAPPPGYEPSIKLQNIKLNPPDEVKLDVGFAEKILEAVRKEIFRAQLEENINGLLKDVFNGAFVGIGEAIGNAITGSDIGEAFNSIFKILGSGLKQLGVFVIAQSKLLAQIQATIAKAPALAIPLGLALVALGTVIQNAIVKKTPGFATGVRGFDGGLALVGERGPELVRLPKGADVIPNSQIGGFGGGLNVNLDWVLRGPDLYALIKRQEMVNKRNF